MNWDQYGSGWKRQLTSKQTTWCLIPAKLIPPNRTGHCPCPTGPYWIHWLYNPQPRWAIQLWPHLPGPGPAHEVFKRNMICNWGMFHSHVPEDTKAILGHAPLERISGCWWPQKLPEEVVKWTNRGPASQFLNAKTHQKYPKITSSSHVEVYHPKTAIILNC